MSLLNKAEDFGKKIISWGNENSPEIMLIGGGICLVAGTIILCIKSFDTPAIIEEHNEKLNDIRGKVVTAEDGTEVVVPGMKREIAVQYVKTGARLLSHYGKGIALEIIGGSLIFGTYKIQRTRIQKLEVKNQALGALSAALFDRFNNYSNAVIDKYGKEADAELRIEADKKGQVQQAEVEITDPLGNKSTQIVDYIRWDQLNDFQIPWCKWTSSRCMDDDFHDECFLKGNQFWASEKLTGSDRHFLTMSEALEGLAITVMPDCPPELDDKIHKMRKDGLTIGWVYEENNPIGDNKCDYRYQRVWMFMPDGEYHHVWVLDFNVDGPIDGRI